MRRSSTSSITASRGVALAERRVDRIVVNLRGEHDMSTVSALTDTMTGAIALDDTDLIVDLGAVRFLDASTIRVILRTRALLRQRSRALTVRDPSACARRLLDLCGLTELIEIDPADDLFPISRLHLVERPKTLPARRPDPTFATKPVLRSCPMPLQQSSPP